MRAAARKIAFPAIILCAVLLLSQCGLPKPYKQLIAPVQIIASGVFQFRKITEASGTNEVEDEFRGFELYYRFFDAASGNEVYADTFEELLSRGYRRVYSKDDRVTSIDKPLIPVDPLDKTKKFTITIEFSALASPDYENAQDAPNITASDIDSPPLNPPLDTGITDFRRGVRRDTPNDDEYKKFSDYVSADSDIVALDWPSFQSSGKLIMYVLSYGYDIAEFGDLYSEPVLLGSITRDFDL